MQEARRLDHARDGRHGPRSVDDRRSGLQLTLELSPASRPSRSRSAWRPTACRWRSSSSAIDCSDFDLLAIGRLVRTRHPNLRGNERTRSHGRRRELNELLDELDRQTAARTTRPSSAPGRASRRPSPSLKLTPEEEAVAGRASCAQLRDLGQKLDETTIEIAAFGMVSRGKSSVLNALLGQDVFKVGATHGTTVARAAQRWEHDARSTGPASKGPSSSWSTRRASTRSAARSARPWPATSPATPT